MKNITKKIYDIIVNTGTHFLDEQEVRRVRLINILTSISINDCQQLYFLFSYLKWYKPVI